MSKGYLPPNFLVSLMENPKLPTYQEYVEYMKLLKVQPLSERTFKSLVKAGFDPIKKIWTDKK